MISTKLGNESSVFLSPLQIQPAIGLIGGATLGALYSPKLAIALGLIGFFVMVYITFYEKIKENSEAYSRLLDEARREAIKEHQHADQLKKAISFAASPSHQSEAEELRTLRYQLIEFRKMLDSVSAESTQPYDYASLLRKRAHVSPFITQLSQEQLLIISDINLKVSTLRPEQLEYIQWVVKNMAATHIPPQPVSGRLILLGEGVH